MRVELKEFVSMMSAPASRYAWCIAVRLGKAKQVVVPFLQNTGIGKSFSSEIFFGKAVLLDHGAHGSVENHDSVVENFFNVHYRNKIFMKTKVIKKRK